MAMYPELVNVMVDNSSEGKQEVLTLTLIVEDNALIPLSSVTSTLTKSPSERVYSLSKSGL